jgi:YegS/Rv2252/BmrU family lipid kinase
VNPISGKGKNSLDPAMVLRVFNPKTFKIEITETLKPSHAIELSLESIKKGVDIIVACGGDGTINEVAGCLIGTSVKLGIIKFGSGNGLATTLNIPKNSEDALRVIKQGITTKIDAGEINNHYFFSNSGIGFDANVINNYSNTKKRQLASYLKASLSTFFSKPPPLSIEIAINSELFSLKPFMVFVSNSNEMGYDISLTPKASIQDGMLDVIIVETLNKLEIIYFAFLLLIKKPQKFKKAHYFLTKNIEITNLLNGSVLTQIDGESRQIDSNTLKISIKKEALSVIIP